MTLMRFRSENRGSEEQFNNAKETQNYFYLERHTKQQFEGTIKGS